MSFERISRAALAALAALLWIGLTSAGCKDEGPYTIRGSARLPDCVESDAAPLDGTRWFDLGVVTIESAGCEPAVRPGGRPLGACACT